MSTSTMTDTMTMQNEDTIAPTSKVTLGLLWTLLVGGLLVTVFFWSKFDSLGDKFVTKELFNARMESLEKQIARMELILDRREGR